MFLLQAFRHKEVCTLIRNLDNKLSNIKTQLDDYMYHYDVSDEFWIRYDDYKYHYDVSDEFSIRYLFSYFYLRYMIEGELNSNSIN